MKKLKQRITISCLAICMLTILGSLSTTISYNTSNTIEPVAETEIVQIQVATNQLKTPLAITDEETIKTEKKENIIYDSSLIKEISDPSIEVNEGVLLENGGEFIEEFKKNTDELIDKTETANNEN